MESLDIAGHLDNWSVSIQLDKKEAARSIYEELNKHIGEYDAEALVTYFLLESRYHAIRGDFQESKHSLVKAREYDGNFTELQKYQLFFAEGIIHYFEKQYQDALVCLEKAEKYVSPSMEPAEIGEFHLIKAMVYYFLDITTLSVVHAARAVENFKSLEPLNFLLARTELVQGMNYLDMSDYEMAEEHLHRALSTCKRIENQSLLASTNLNLGLLYSTRGLPATAIRYLEDALAGKQERIELNVLYLLADSYWKTNQATKAKQAYAEGFQKSLENDDTKMKWEFAMLHKKYEDRHNFESVWQEGIEYFQKVNDKYNVRLFSKELAQYYTDSKQYELATKYYLLALI
ncbi:tetratricopeptide repeat protein [Terribacillus saccharophilus]|uniref:tetratricopeptide repeat protein n=1 Tax=Terribacillus saccharophilus TaxID=361277 RepID=UPI0015CAD148|nr:tetratricopeptide repeat protein [Terribacillus saccharophilus]